MPIGWMGLRSNQPEMSCIPIGCHGASLQQVGIELRSDLLEQNLVPIARKEVAFQTVGMELRSIRSERELNSNKSEWCPASKRRNGAQFQSVGLESHSNRSEWSAIPVGWNEAPLR